MKLQTEHLEILARARRHVSPDGWTWFRPKRWFPNRGEAFYQRVDRAVIDLARWGMLKTTRNQRGRFCIRPTEAGQTAIRERIPH